VDKQKKKKRSRKKTSPAAAADLVAGDYKCSRVVHEEPGIMAGHEEAHGGGTAKKTPAVKRKKSAPPAADVDAGDYKHSRVGHEEPGIMTVHEEPRGVGAAKKIPAVKRKKSAPPAATALITVKVDNDNDMGQVMKDNSDTGQDEVRTKKKKGRPNEKTSASAVVVAAVVHVDADEEPGIMSGHEQARGGTAKKTHAVKRKKSAPPAGTALISSVKVGNDNDMGQVMKDNSDKGQDEVRTKKKKGRPT